VTGNGHPFYCVSPGRTLDCPTAARDQTLPDHTLIDRLKFAELGRPRRIWAIGAVHGDVHRLAALHDDLGQRFQPGDRLIYLGNYSGPGPYVRAAA
jgi:hypothetical protein